MISKPVAIIFFYFLLPISICSQELIHQFDFNGNFRDSKSADSSLYSLGCTTQKFDQDGWSWTSDKAKGGGLVLKTNKLLNPKAYSIGLQLKFNQTGSSYKKIISFKDSLSDGGLYFYNGLLVLYPLKKDTNIFVSGQFYNFLINRNEQDTLAVYLVDGDMKKLVYKVFDTNEYSVPAKVDHYHVFEFFRDDNTTQTEYTTGGTVKNINLWNGTGMVSGVISNEIHVSNTSCFVQNDQLQISGDINNKRILVCNNQGFVMVDFVATCNTASVNLPINGIYIVNIEGERYKIIIN